MNAIEILRAASRSVPNEEYVQFMGAVDAVAELIASDKAYEATRAALVKTKIDNFEAASDLFDAACKRRIAALANVGGAA